MFKTILTAATIALAAASAQAAPLTQAADLGLVAPSQTEELSYYCEWAYVYDAWGNWAYVWQCY